MSDCTRNCWIIFLSFFVYWISVYFVLSFVLVKSLFRMSLVSSHWFTLARTCFKHKMLGRTPQWQGLGSGCTRWYYVFWTETAWGIIGGRKENGINRKRAKGKEETTWCLKGEWCVLPCNTFFFQFLKKIGENCFTMLSWFLPYNSANQL